MSEDELGNVTRFPVKRAQAGRIYCPPLNIHFPQLFRVVQTVTQADIIAAGLTDEQPFENFVHYTLHEDAEYFGTIEREGVRSIAETGQESAIIRHHRDLKEAYGYLDALADLLGAEDISPICRTRDGLFTLARRPTPSAWPGPMAIYLATHPATNIAGWEEWVVGIAPDGKSLQGEEFEF